MRDIIIAQLRGLALQWRGEADTVRRRSGDSPAVTAMGSCADELEGTLAALEQDTRPLTVRQYAREHNAEPATVRRWIARGELEATKADSGDWLIPRHARRVRRATAGSSRLEH